MSRDDDFNPILAKEYRDCHYEIYLDAERECLVGAILEFNGYGDCDSDSLTHLKEQIERAIDLDITYKYQNKLEKENKELRQWTKLHDCEYPYDFSKPPLTKLIELTEEAGLYDYY